MVLIVVSTLITNGCNHNNYPSVKVKGVRLNFLFKKSLAIEQEERS